MVQGVLIQYKFILPAGIKHSSYTYQKLFRAIYGYTQNVSKSNGKTYRYHRPGVLSTLPHTKPGKNAVLVPPSALAALADFFKTGKNPSHDWHVKGDWKAVYYTDQKVVSPAEATKALEAAAQRVLSSFGLGSESDLSTESAAKEDEGKLKACQSELARLAACEWAKDCAPSALLQKLFTTH